MSEITFEKLVEEQFLYGGVKYASTSSKEATDELTEDFGWNWLIGTQGKYVKRYRNQGLEKDLLKMACYQYINWLKRGYHLSPYGTAEMKCTTVEVKSEFFGTFMGKLSDLEEYYRVSGFNTKTLPAGTVISPALLDKIYNNYLSLRNDIQERYFFETFVWCKQLWLLAEFDKAAVHHTDTGAKK